MRLKKVATLLLASTIVIGVTACGNSQNSGESSKSVAENGKDSKDDTLTIWAWDEAFNIKAAENAKEIFLKDNPDVKINIVTMAQDDIVAKLNTSLSSRSYAGLPCID